MLLRLRRDDAGNAATTLVRVTTLLAGFLAVAVVAGVLSAGLVLPAAGAAGYLTRSGVDYYEELPTDLDIPPLSQTSAMFDADDRLIARFYSENRVSTSLARMGEWAPKAIIAVEDERFYEHGGLDTRGTIRALANNVLGGSQQGASTLTQQYVKQVQLEAAVYSGDPEQLEAVQAQIAASGPVGYGRKLREAKLAISLEEQLTKDEILERYLNIANFGNATYGIQAAAQRYFSVNASDLTLAQAALLAGVVQSPSRWDPLDNPEAAISRRNTVLFRMLDTGAITEEQYAEASASELQLAPREPRRGCITAGNLAYFCDYVIRIFLSDPRYGETVEERENLLNRGGLRIMTTIDREVQDLAWQAVRTQVTETDRAGVALSVVQPGSGKILAMAQNRQYGGDGTDPAFTFTNYNVDQRYGGGVGFQPGSNMKPIVLATWLEQGRTLNERVPAPQRREFRFRDFTQCGSPVRRDNQTFPINNSGGTASSLSIAEATFRSSNTAYVEITSQLDLCDIQEMATRVGLTPATDPDGQVEMQPVMALGVSSVSPLSVAEAYATFAAEGVHCNSYAIRGITDREGNNLSIPQADCQQVVDADVARGVNEALQETLVEGTARRSEFTGTAAGKTGTTSGSVAVWFTGYTPEVAASVWVGDPGVDGRPQSLESFPVNGRRIPEIFGSTLSLPTWDRFMIPASQQFGWGDEEFTDPDDDIVFGPQFAVPSVRGDSVDAARQELERLGLRVSVSGSRQFSDSVPEGRVVGQSPGSGALLRRGDSVTLVLSAGEEPPPPPPPAPEPEPTPTPTPTPQPSPPSGGNGGGGNGGGGNGGGGNGGGGGGDDD